MAAPDARRPVRNGPLSSSSLSAAAAPEAGATWECHKCGLPNDPSKKRCSSCQGWRGGSREGYSFSAIYAARKRKKREEEEEQSGGGEGDGGRRRWGSVEREEEEEEGRE